MREISDYTQALINDIKTSDGKFRHDNVTRHRCPECGKFYWKSMENTENVWYVRTVPADIKDDFKGHKCQMSRMP